MSASAGSSSPGVAALKLKLQQQVVPQESQAGGKTSSPSTKRLSGGVSKSSSPGITKAASTKEAGKPPVSGSAGKTAPLLPKSGSPGFVREDRQPPKSQQGSPKTQNSSQAKSTLAKVLSCQPDFGRGGQHPEKSSPGSVVKLGSSVDSSNSEDDESSVFRGKRLPTPGVKKAPPTPSRLSGSSTGSDLCDLSGHDHCRLPGALPTATPSQKRENELVASKSEENIAALTGNGARFAKTGSVTYDGRASDELRRKPLPLTPKSVSIHKFKPEDKNKSLSASNLKTQGITGNSATNTASKPQVAKIKPSVPSGKPKGESSPQMNRKPKGESSPQINRKPKPTPSSKPKLDSTKHGEKVGGNWAELPKPVENRSRTPITAGSVSGKDRESLKSPEKSSTSPGGKKACLLPPSKPVKPISLGGTSPSNVRARRRRSSSPENLSLDSHEVKLAILNTPDEELLNSDFSAPKKGSKPPQDLENTLTNSQTRDLESTLVGTGEETNEWVMVKKKKEEEEKARKAEASIGTEGSHTSKKLPTTPTKKRTPSSNSDTPSSPASSQPSRPSIETSPGSLKSGGSGRSSAKSNKINALMDKFSGQSSTPPPQPGRVYGGGRSGGTDVPEGKPKPPAKPTGGVATGEPVAPATSNGLLSVDSCSTTNIDSQQERGVSSGRGNTDSGFISEAPEDLGLRRDVSVESLPGAAGAERGGAVTPSMSPVGGAETGEVQEDETKREQTEAVAVVWDEAKLEKARKKRVNIVKELLQTEKTYSGRIKVVAVDFYDIVLAFNKKSKQPISEAALSQIFLNIRPIYSLSENILQELQQRFDAWSTKEALGDVIGRLAPFLKLYSTYTSGFEDAMRTLTDATKKDRKFDAVVREFEKEKISTGLGLSSFMLEPVQRIPRYRLLLLDYLKYLPPDSPDQTPTEKALRIISEAADRSNDRIKELENSNELLAIQRSLVEYEGTLLVPSRSFIMKGALLKSSRKTLTARFFFLFSDVLLHTYPPENNIYRFRNEMQLCGMQVEDPRVSLMPFSFNIYSTTRSLILVACSEEEKQSWISALENAIRNEVRKTSSLKRDANLRVKKIDTLFGTKAPLMVPDRSVTMCQMCGTEFTIIFRRHHCRACGKVVCGDCSKQKAYLPYMAKMERVCSPCFFESKNPDRTSTSAAGEELTDSPSHSPMANKKQDSTTSNHSGVLFVCGTEGDAVIAGYVLSQEGKKWSRMWYQVKSDCVLYKFKAHEDIKALTSMPLPGYTLNSDLSSLSISLKHPSGKKGLCDTFRLEGTASYENWMTSLMKVMELDSSSANPVSPLARSLERSGSNELKRSSKTFSNSSRPCSSHSSGSRPNSFTMPGSRPSSTLEPSPPSVFKDSFESL